MKDSVLLRPSYPLPPIGSIETLARILGFPVEVLINVQGQCDELYRLAKIIPKPDGSHREVFGAQLPLKLIQTRITKRIFRKVVFPYYLQGGVFARDPMDKRDDVRNAALHVGSKTLISEDIGNYFPSLTSAHVLGIWKYFFQFPDDVAKILTNLTTRQGTLPQGASTSTTLANLIFWDKEPELVRRLNAMGYKYSRFIDDISISSDFHLISTEKYNAISMVIAMMSSVDCKPNRRKHRIQHSNEPMNVHRLNVNSTRPSIPKVSRNLLRARLHNFKRRKGLDNPDDTLSEYNSLSGHITRVTRMHPALGKQMRKRLNAAKP